MECLFGWYTLYIWSCAILGGAFSCTSQCQSFLWAYHHLVTNTVLRAFITVVAFGYTIIHFFGLMCRLCYKGRKKAYDVMISIIFLLILNFATIGLIWKESKGGWCLFYDNLIDKGLITAPDVYMNLLTTGACVDDYNTEVCVKKNVEESYTGIMIQIIIVCILYIIELVIILIYPHVYKMPPQYSNDNDSLDGPDNPAYITIYSVKNPSAQIPRNILSVTTPAYTPSSQHTTNRKPENKDNSYNISGGNSNNKGQSLNYSVKQIEMQYV